MKWALFLKELRKEYGFSSSKEFFSYLQDRGLDCNYPYYMKMEQGKAFPSAQIVNQIAKGLEEADAKKLILGYCKELFPQHTYLFQAQQDLKSKRPLPHLDPLQQTGPRNDKELTERQIAILVQSKVHYHLFVLLTMAREGIVFDKLKVYYEESTLTAIFQELEKEKLVYREEKVVFPINTDIRFPSASNSVLKAYYKQFDLWDLDMCDDFKFEEVVAKIFLRRISPRYLGLIQKNLDFLFELVKSSDEVDKRYNETVIQFKLSLRKGQLPG